MKQLRENTMQVFAKEGKLIVIVKGVDYQI